MTATMRVVLIVSLIALAGLVVVGIAVNHFIGLKPTIETTFGDQHLKTTVAVVELHKVRFGRYPAALSDLRYTGEWDAIALSAVEYCATGDGSRYFVKVQRGWASEPDLDIPQDFWQGTGFDSAIGSCDQ